MARSDVFNAGKCNVWSTKNFKLSIRHTLTFKHSEGETCKNINLTKPKWRFKCYQCIFGIKFFDDNYAKFQHKIWRKLKWRLKWYQSSFSHKFFNDNFVSNVTPFSNARVVDVFTYSELTRENTCYQRCFPETKYWTTV